MPGEKKEEEKKNEELEKFSQLASALFGVNRKDVPKHEPKKRIIAGNPDDPEGDPPPPASATRA